ncbi:23S rRNA pseudouridine(2604) synthase RluF [Petrocella sp. FN5]|uniref:23S rRNA pseudouridine(2604) synthase RluF n=1 Tax=Petrocella sp. FN5 TaxID=3032002 RepID=UPI0023DC7FF8|nr:23S rRNA pseudouridine(2604) synthase RluF [Petrocella sp. FN5]MDF1616283.1 23S rRNA pseudouridine(2604) synthase RluF [Petrocella sp. FN5]
MTDSMRLNKYISESGTCSRREADKLIQKGVVTINGKIALVGSKVENEDSVAIEGEIIKSKTDRVYMAFNKPVGVTCTTDMKDPTNIVDYIGYKERIFPIGRLDKMSEGLIFMTNDGDIVNKILRSGNQHEKEYVVTVDKPITDDFIRKMERGVPILKTKTKPCKIERIGKSRFKIILVQGLNRQIRRMCEVFGYTVVKLKRIRIMNIELRGIESGQWRYLDQGEIKEINRLIRSSSKTEEASLKE